VPSKPVKVLFAEDEVLVRLMMAEALRGEGFQVFEASDGEEGISVLKAMPVDVVITDLRMSAVADGT
jgi:CheY-like chemotaxis protein